MDTTPHRSEIPVDVVRIWQRVVDSVADLAVVPSVMINRLEPATLEVFRSNAGPDNPFPSGTRMPLAGLYCESAAVTRDRVQVVDARKDPVWADSPTARAGIYAYLGYPLMWPDGGVFGTLCAVDTKENAWGDRVEGLLVTFREAIEAHLALVNTLERLEAKNQELNQALSEVKTLRGMLPMCACCKKIRDDTGYWSQIETYIGRHADVVFSHGVCPECYTALYPGYPAEG